MKTLTLIASTLLIAASLAGCAEKKNDDAGADGKGSATSVTAAAPTSPSGGKSEVCWTVAGSGNVAHVAIHWDTESHAGAADRTFAMYDAGAAYPDNTAALDPEGYDLPGDFCADVDVPATGTLYIVGHVIDADGPPGVLSNEVTLAGTANVPTSGPYALTTTGVPSTATAGVNFTFSLVIAGPPGTSDHIGAHFGKNTTTGTGAPAADAGSCVHTNGTLPGQFTVACTIMEAGTWHLRGHLRTGSAGNYSHWWASENTIVVAAANGTGDPAGANLTIVNIAQGYTPNPLTVAPGATVTVKNSDTLAAHTVTSDDGTSFDTGSIAAGQSDTFTAPTTAGDYPYHCALHPTMKGTLRVA